MKLATLLASTLFCLHCSHGFAAPFPQQRIASLVEQTYQHDSLEAAREAYLGAPDNHQAQFWMVYLGPGAPQTSAASSKLLASTESGPWTLLNRASRSPVAAPALIEQAIAAAPNDPDVLQAGTIVLIALEEGDTTCNQLKAFLANHQARFDKSADLLVTEAYADQQVFFATSDKLARRQLDTHLQAAVALNPNNEDAVVFLVHELRAQSVADVYALLQKESALLPTSYAVQTQWWSVELAQPNGTILEPQIKDTILAMLDRHEPTLLSMCELLDAIRDAPGSLWNDVGDKIIAKYPESVIADEARVRKAVLDLPLSTAEQNRAAKISALAEFEQRTNHPDKGIIEYAARMSESLLAEQDPPNLPALFAAVEKAPGISYGIRVLAAYKYRLPDLERIAFSALNEQWQTVHESLEAARDITPLVQFLLGDYVHFHETNLGMVYYEEGKLNLAQAALQTAVNLEPNDSVSTTALAKLYGAKGNYARAHELLVAALGQRHYGLEINPALEALRQLYAAEHHSTVGLDAFMKPILEKATVERKVDVVVTKRYRNAKPIPAFTLTDLKGKPVQLSDYKGKILVINFWATWCGPCRAEFPQFQQLAEKYANDSSVALLAVSIDTAETPTTSISKYIDSKKFTFQVARGDAYATDHNIATIPLTWFVDAQGNKIYSKLGNSPELLQEFSWRIDAMKDAPPSTIVSQSP